jgi:hypothetical protein
VSGLENLTFFKFPRPDTGSVLLHLYKISKEENRLGSNKLPITCPLCGRKSEHPLESLVEGAPLICPYCKIKLMLHGHMWEEIQMEIANLKAKK